MFEQNFVQGRKIFLVSPLLLLAVILNFNITNCSSFSLNGKPTGVAPWKIGLLALSASGSKATSSSSNSDDDDPLIFGNSEKSTTGFIFVHTNNLGSVTSFTDGNGDLVTGGQFEGASDIKYLPYGTIDQKNSKGPKLSAFTFTGQREETSTGLMYYNFRFYDATIGRFISPDDRIFPDKLSGMNRYMYVGGNPIMQNDPTGHKGNAWVHDFNKFVKRAMKEITFQAQRQALESLSPELRFAYGIVKSGGKVNYFNKKKSGFLKTQGRKMREAGDFTKKFLTDGNFQAGVEEGLIDLGLSYINNAIEGKPAPFLTYHNGGYIVHNSYLADHTVPIGTAVVGSKLGGSPEGNYASGNVGHLSSKYDNLRYRKKLSGMMNGSPVVMNDLTFQSGILVGKTSPYQLKQSYGNDVLKAFAMTNLYAMGSDILSTNSLNAGLNIDLTNMLLSPEIYNFNKYSDDYYARYFMEYEEFYD